MEDPLEVSYALLLVKNKCITPEQMAECLEIKRKLLRQGVTVLPSLAEILIQKGYLQEQQDIDQLLDPLAYQCSHCGKTYTQGQVTEQQKVCSVCQHPLEKVPLYCNVCGKTYASGELTHCPDCEQELTPQLSQKALQSGEFEIFSASAAQYDFITDGEHEIIIDIDEDVIPASSKPEAAPPVPPSVVIAAPPDEVTPQGTEVPVPTLTTGSDNFPSEIESSRKEKTVLLPEEQVQRTTETVRLEEDEAAAPSSGEAAATRPEETVRLSQPSPPTSDSGSGGTSAPESSTAGPYFAKYEILKEVGRGGMGVVYQARHRGTGQILALKTLSLNVNEDMIKRFQREARAAAALDHPNIARVHDIGVENNVYYLTMDFVKGISLEEYIKSAHFELHKGLEFAKQVAQGLAYAHQHGIIHRDIKAANIIINQDQQAKIVDFGLAKNITEDTQVTRTGITMGTPGHMAPEQVRGDQQQIDQQSDIFSLGVVIYLILTGEMPFKGSTVVELFYAVINTEPIPPREINPEITPDMQTVCLKALEKDKRHRYQTAQELADELDKILKGEPIVAKPLTRMEKIWRQLKRQRRLVLAVATPIVLLLLILAAAFYQIVRLQRAQATKPDKLYHQAARHYHQGHYQRAIKLLQGLLKIHPEYSQAYGLLGRAYAHTKAGDTQAIAYLRQALTSPTASAESMLLLLKLYYRNQQYQPALQLIAKYRKKKLSQYLQQALTFEEAKIYLATHLPDKCIQICGQLLQAQPANSAYYELRGQAYQLLAQKYEKKDYAQARAIYHKADADYSARQLLASQKDTAVYVRQANIAFKLKNYAQALKHLALAYQRSGDLKLIERWQQYAAIWRDSLIRRYTQWLEQRQRLEYYYERGCLYLAAENFKLAQRDLQTCRRLAPQHRLTRTLALLMDWRTKRPRQPYPPDCPASAPVNSTDYRWYLCQARTYFQQQVYRLALGALDSAVALIDKHKIARPPFYLLADSPWMVFLLRGRTHLHLGARALAQADFQTCRMLNPLAAAPYYYQALCRQDKKPAACIAFYERISACLPAAQREFYKGRLYEALQRPQSALACYRNCISQAPQMLVAWQRCLTLLQPAQPQWQEVLATLAPLARQYPHLAPLYLKALSQLPNGPQRLAQVLPQFPGKQYDYFRALVCLSANPQRARSYLQNVPPDHPYFLHSRLLQQQLQSQQLRKMSPSQPDRNLSLDERRATLTRQWQQGQWSQALDQARYLVKRHQATAYDVMQYFQLLLLLENFKEVRTCLSRWRYRFPQVCRWAAAYLAITQNATVTRTIVEPPPHSPAYLSYAYHYLHLRQLELGQEWQAILQIPQVAKLAEHPNPWQVLPRPLQSQATFIYLRALQQLGRNKQVQAFWQKYFHHFPGDFGMRWEQLQYYAQQGQWTSVYLQARQLLLQKAPLPGLRPLLAQACYHLHLYDEAIHLFQQGAQADEHSDFLVYHLALCYLGQKRNQQARAVLEKLVTSGDYAPAILHLLLAILLQQPADLTAARKYAAKFHSAQERQYYQIRCDELAHPKQDSLLRWRHYTAQFKNDYRGYRHTAQAYCQKEQWQAALAALQQMEHCLPPDQQHQAQLLTGQVYLRWGQLRKAAHFFERVAAHYPRVNLLLYELYLQQGATAKATQIWQRLIRQRGLLAQVRLIEGRQLLQHGDVRQALHMFERLPDDPQALLYTGLHFLQLGDATRAAKRLKLYAQKVPHSSEGYTLYGWALARQGSQRQALQAYQQAIQQDQSNWRAHLLRADLLQQQHRYHQALAALQQAHKLAPHQVGITFNLAALQLQLGYYDQAYENLQQCQERMAEQPAWQNNMAVLEFMQGNVQEAQRILQHLLQVDEHNRSARFNSALLALERGDWAQARTILEKLQRERPGSARPWALLAKGALRRRDLLQCQQYLAQALACSQQVLETYLVQAEYHLQQKQTSLATEDYQHGLQDLGPHPELLYNLARLQYHSGQASAALDSLRQLHRLEPQYAWFNLTLGLVYLEQRHTRQAKWYLKRALKQNALFRFLKYTHFCRILAPELP